MLQNTREYLRRSISIGTKDVYKLNDTHWSVVGADIVGGALYDWMKESGFILWFDRAGFIEDNLFFSSIDLA